MKKLSVKASLVVMTLKMNAIGNKKFGLDLSGRFPDFTMQWNEQDIYRWI